MAKKKLSEKMRVMVRDEVKKVRDRLIYENNTGIEPMESIGVHQNDKIQKIADSLREESMTDEEYRAAMKKYNDYMRKNRWK